MSSAAVVAMASEPPAAQPAKLHPLFAARTANAQRQNHDENEIPKPQPEAEPQARLILAPETRTGDVPTAMHPLFSLVSGLGEPAVKETPNFQRETTPEAEKKRKQDTGPVGHAEGVQQTQAEDRPQKKQKGSPKVTSIADHFVRASTGNPDSVASASPAPSEPTESTGHDEATFSAANEGVLPQQPYSLATGKEKTLPPPPSFVLTSLPCASPSGVPPTVSTESQAASTPTPPKRLLLFNPKTGTIGSPPKPKESPPVEPKPRGRPRKKPPSLIVTVKYGLQDDASRLQTAAKINDILAGNFRKFPLQLQEGPKSTAKRGAKATQATNVELKLRNMSTPTPNVNGAPPKSTHPFFMGGVQKGAPASSSPADSNTTKGSSPAGFPSASKYYTSTPCSPKRQRMAPAAASGFRMPQFGIKNGILRVPGACQPAWPWKGTAHVRPEDISMAAIVTAADKGTPQSLHTIDLPLRKSKGNAVELRQEESILEMTAQRLNVAMVVDKIRSANPEDFQPPPTELRLPQKYVESGRKLQRRIAPELRTNDQGLQALFDSLQTRLSAFDQYQCETLSWAQKYTPACAAEVLQTGREPQMLRDWLAALKVVSVDTGPGDATAVSSTAKGAKAPKKRRKKNKLDGFIVSSDDDDDGLGETSDAELDWSASGKYGLQKSTVIRTGELNGGEGAKLTNALVISGPHGCGKTAAVYAVAKELGFSVFEINASSRRNGRDVIDRIGDMTRNHMVQHKQKQNTFFGGVKSTAEGGEDGTTTDGQAEDEKDVDEEVASGKQATMNAFFKPKAATNNTGAPAKRGRKPKQRSESTAATTTNGTAKSTSSPQSQKQSLILLEEADLLYEEDKQFWATVMGLVVQSKRPFVITCNDETLLPLANLRLHAILRFSPPPADAAVDRLLLVAACEGHWLPRKAVEALYTARGADMRASLQELHFWCQIGVGDQRGGFDWFQPRWPAGVDLDEEQQVVRVVSGNTYHEGMGWVARDLVGNAREAADMAAAVEEQLLQDAWRDWQLDMGQWGADVCSITDTEISVTGGSETFDKQRARQLLDGYTQFADTMSDADLMSVQVFATGNTVPLDATQPELPVKARDDFILGRQLLDQTTAAYENDQLRLPTVTALRCAAKQSWETEKAKAGQGVKQTDIDQTQAGKNDSSVDHSKRLDEAQAVANIRNTNCHCNLESLSINRIDFSLAFDSIAVAEGSGGAGIYQTGLDPSVFDRNLQPIVLDVAPFVRSIVAFDGRLQRQRQRMFLSEGGGVSDESNPSSPDPFNPFHNTINSKRPAKRMRTTRAALSALEGGPRSSVRKERWFTADVNAVLVKRTGGGDSWEEAVREAVEEQRERLKENPKEVLKRKLKEQMGEELKQLGQFRQQQLLDQATALQKHIRQVLLDQFVQQFRELLQGPLQQHLFEQFEQALHEVVGEDMGDARQVVSLDSSPAPPQIPHTTHTESADGLQQAMRRRRDVIMSSPGGSDREEDKVSGPPSELLFGQQLGPPAGQQDLEGSIPTDDRSSQA